MNLNNHRYNSENVDFSIRSNVEGITRRTRELYRLITEGKIYSYNPDFAITTATQLDEMMTELTGFYEDNWDFILKPMRLENAKYQLYCVLRFPELTISNSIGLSHNIQDLFVYFRLDQGMKDGEPYVYPVDLKGFRSTVTTLERQAEYEHSHLPSKNRSKVTDLKGNSFCLGATEIRDTHLSLVDRYDKDRFSLLLFTIQSFVKWESVEGVPYLYINDIPSSLGDSDNRYREYGTNLMGLYTELEPHLKVFPFKFSVYGNRLVLQDKKFKEDLKKLIRLHAPSFVEKVLVRQNSTGRYFCYDSARDATADVIPVTVSSEVEDNYFYFRGEKITPKIINPEQDVEQTGDSIENYFVHPDIVNYVKKKIEKDAYELSVRYAGELESNSATGSAEEN